MNKRERLYTIQIMGFVVFLLIFCWCLNLYKLTKCDFSPNYRCEILHGIGIAGPISVFTVWTGVDF